MDPKKIAFIICVNDIYEYSEAEYYLNRLILPEGYEKEILTVKEAPSMTAGYNAAMSASGAKYKVYLHQDVFIINRSFIADMLRVFKENPNAGMLGCIGCDSLPLHAQAVAAWNVGLVYHNCIPMKMERRQNRDRSAIAVEALDGLLLATQQDVRWREDLFDGWDFYDVSQCFEMRRAGHGVIVPYQEQPWCYHDNTYSKMTRYAQYCERFIEEYKDIKAFRNMEYSEAKKEMDGLKESSRKQLKAMVDCGLKKELAELFSAEQNRGYLHLREFEILADIYSRETRAGADLFWEAGDTCENLIRRIAELRFALKRIEYGADDGGADTVLKRYTPQAVSVVSEKYVIRE